MRITGLATGLDMDEVIKESMKPYRVKIQKQEQQKEIIEIKQQLYRDVLKDSRDFYNKYFDIAKSDSILASKNWSSVKFESADSSVVSVTSTAQATVKNYTITGNSATATKAVMTEGIGEDDKIVINGKEFTLKGSTERERANNLNKELEAAKINVSVKFSDMAGTEDTGNKKGFIFESTVLGSGGAFSIGGTVDTVQIEETKGTNATNGKITGIAIEDIKREGIISFGDKAISLDLEDGKEYTDAQIVKILNDKLTENDVDFKGTVDKDGKITLTSKTAGKIPEVEVKVGSTVGTLENGKDSTPLVNSMNLSEVEGKVLFINGKNIEIPMTSTGEVNLEELNKLLEGSELKAEIVGDKFTLTSAKAGDIKSIDISVVTKPQEGFVQVVQGTDANIVIKDNKGGVYTHTGDSNTITLDGVTFKFDGEIPADGIKITGKQDTTQTKDMLVNFFNDYNNLMVKLNTLTSEKRNKNYDPLTSEQKEAMSENEIKLWEAKVKQGQLSRDNDISRITNSLKSAVTTMVEGTGLNLEAIGIKPVSDYGGVNNGTFSIDEDKLSKALENNSEAVMKMFIGTSNEEGLTSSQVYSKTGIAQRMKTILYDETMTVSSRLLKKAGYEGTSTSVNNELTRSIENYEKKIATMEKTFSRKEQALYSKYATLETMMNKLNAQQSSLLSQLGMS